MDYGGRSLRNDLLLVHEKSGQHRDAVKAAPSKTGRIDLKLKTIDSQQQLVTEDATQIINFIVQHNLSLDLFGVLVGLAFNLGATPLAKLNAAEKATDISSNTVSGLLNCLNTQKLCRRSTSPCSAGT